jgi:hypothetical protein
MVESGKTAMRGKFRILPAPLRRGLVYESVRDRPFAVSLGLKAHRK